MFWFAAAAIFLWFLAFFYLNAIIRRRTGPDHILSLLQEEVRQLEADIDAKTEQNLQLLEEKIRALREMCSEAERRIALYSRELDIRNREGEALGRLGSAGFRASGGQPGKESSGRMAGTSGQKKNRDSIVSGSPGRGEQRDIPYPLLRGLELQDDETASPPVLPGPKIVAAPIHIKGPPLKDRIAELYRAGFALELIAERLGIPIGEVKVYINMIEGKPL